MTIRIIIEEYSSAYTLHEGELIQHAINEDGSIDTNGAVDFERIPADERGLLREVEKCLDQLDTAAIGAGL